LLEAAGTEDASVYHYDCNGTQSSGRLGGRGGVLTEAVSSHSVGEWVVGGDGVDCNLHASDDHVLNAIRRQTLLPLHHPASLAAVGVEAVVRSL
jgi:hypothetical protein